MKAQAGASAVINRNNQQHLIILQPGSAKVAYARDGYLASLAADLGYDGDAFGADSNEFNNEICNSGRLLCN